MNLNELDKEFRAELTELDQKLKLGNAWPMSFREAESRKIMIEFALQQINKLDNIEYNRKVKVSQFLADWYEEHKHDILSAKYSSLDTDEDERVREWYGKCEGRHPNSRANAQEVIAKMDLNGYEVEEEPKYFVVLPSGQHLTKDSKANEYLFVFDAGQAVELTEDEIKGISKDYQPFAVPVEEVNHEL